MFWVIFKRDENKKAFLGGRWKCVISVTYFIKRSNEYANYPHQWRLRSGLHLDMIRCTFDVNYRSQSNKKGTILILCKLKVCLSQCSKDYFPRVLISLPLNCLSFNQRKSLWSLSAEMMCFAQKLIATHSRLSFIIHQSYSTESNCYIYYWFNYASGFLVEILGESVRLEIANQNTRKMNN